MIYIIAAILIFGVLIAVHELGHFLAAKACGVRVNEFSMLEDQQYILEEILRIIDSEKPDGVLIAGDVYDKTVPSAEAVTLLDEFLVQLSKRDTQTFLISGNHDSAERLAFGGRLMEQSGIHIARVYNGVLAPLTLRDEYGRFCGRCRCGAFSRKAKSQPTPRRWRRFWARRTSIRPTATCS